MKRRYYIIIIIGLTLIGMAVLINYSRNKTYTVTLDLDGGKLLNKVSIKRGETIKNIAKPTKENYLFVSWLLNGIEYDENTPITEDIKLEAKWILAPVLDKKYKVAFNIDNKIKTQTIKEGDLVEKPKDPTKVNCKFIGWYLNDNLYDFNTPVTKNITLIAKFENNLVTVNYDLDGGSGTKVESITKGEILPKPKDPTKFGYKFVKWTLNNQDYNFNTKVTEDITLKAVWVAVEYVKVKFDTDGGSEITPQTIEKGSKLKDVPNPTKEGYTFKYWSLYGGIFDINTPIKDNYTLKAVYEKVE